MKSNQCIPIKHKLNLIAYGEFMLYLKEKAIRINQVYLLQIVLSCHFENSQPIDSRLITTVPNVPG